MAGIFVGEYAMTMALKSRKSVVEYATSFIAAETEKVAPAACIDQMADETYQLLVDLGCELSDTAVEVACRYLLVGFKFGDEGKNDGLDTQEIESDSPF
jgi:hypothetical protein